MALMTNQPAILAHGGAGSWKADPADVLPVMESAVSAGWEILRSGGSALDAAERATVILEEHPLFDAGIGSHLNQQGEVEMDALIADGRSLNFGAVAAVKRVRNPIRLARLVLEQTPHCLLVADGADEFAREMGLPLLANLDFVTDAELETFRSHRQPLIETYDTVGCVALDVNGHVCAASSTGGTRLKLRGRVGDTPMFGAGAYADDAVGAACATGVGENSMRFLISKRTVDGVAGGQTPQTAIESALEFVAQRIDKPELGVIVVDSQGRLGALHTTLAMPVAWVDSEGQVKAAMTAQGLLWR